MQPILSAMLHIHSIDLKLFDREDFVDRPKGFTGLIEAKALDKLVVSRSQSQIEEDYKGSKQLIFSKKSITKTHQALHYQMLILDTCLSHHKLKNMLFKTKKEILKRQLYKYEKSLLTVRSIRLAEDLSSGQAGFIKHDCLQLPQAYRYDNFVELALVKEHMVNEKLLSIEVGLQPFKFKMRQQVLKFFLNFKKSND